MLIDAFNLVTHLHYPTELLWFWVNGYKVLLTTLITMNCLSFANNTYFVHWEICEALFLISNIGKADSQLVALEYLSVILEKYTCGIIQSHPSWVCLQNCHCQEGKVVCVQISIFSGSACHHAGGLGECQV